MSSTSTLLAVLAAIEKQNKARYKKIPALTHYSGGKGPAPYTHSKHTGVVDPKTSKGATSDNADKRSGGILGTVKNLGKDIEDTVTGIPGGIIQTIHHPVATAEAVGKDYKKRYGPLLGYLNGGGDIGKFGREIQQHPLAPLLDAASVATGGGALAAKVGQSARVAKVIADSAKVSHAAEVEKAAVATAPLRKGIEALTKKADKAGIDRDAAAVRAETVHPDRIAAIKSPFEDQLKKLERKQATAEAQLEKSQKLAVRPGSAVKTKAAHTEVAATAQREIDTLQGVMKKVVRDRNKAVREGKVVPEDVAVSSRKAFERHSKTVEDLQKQIAEHHSAIAKIEIDATSAAKAATMPAHISALVKLQRMTTGGYRYIAADKGGEFKSIKVAQHNNPVKRLRQNLGIAAQESVIPQRTPLIGLESRAKKAANLQRDVESQRIRHTQRAVVAAADALEKVGNKSGKSQAMATAAQALIDGVAPADYARLVRDTRSHGDEIQNSIRQGLTQDEHHALTDQIVKPHTDKMAQDLFQGAQQYMQREALTQGRHIDAIHLQHGFKSKLINSPEVRAIVDLQKAHAKAATDAMEQLVKNKMLTHDQASVQAVLHTTLARAAQGLKPRTEAETMAAFDKAGLPRPSYNPDTLTLGEGSQRAGMLRESKGTLYSRGTRHNTPMNIVMRHELASKATDLASAHKLMLAAARKIEPGASRPPKGYIWIRDTLADDLNAKNAMFRKEMMEDGAPLGEDYFRILESEKRPKGGYAIRKDVADDLAAGRKAMSAARAESLTRGVTAWKFLVLTRPAFLVHNVISNQLMFHLKNGWHSMVPFRNAKTALESGVFKEHHNAESLSFSEDTLGKKQKSRVGKALNIFYKLTAQHEHYLRELTMYETARKMPEVQREMRALKGGKYDAAAHEGRTMFHEAYNRAVVKSPHVRDLVTRNIDDTLGNYRYYTAQERQLKNISPFYGWERHSVRNMVRMMEDNPATMAMLTQIGMVGHDKFNKDFGPGMPGFVKSYVQDSYIQTIAQHLGLGDDVSMYDFNSTNPWTTAVSIGKAATGDRDAAVGLAGPLVTGPMEALTGKSALTGAPSTSKFDKYGPVGGMIDRVVTSTPPVALWDSLTSDKNEKKKLIKSNDRQEVGKQFGLDFRNADKAKLRSMEAAKHVKRDKYGHPVSKKKKPNPFYK